MYQTLVIRNHSNRIEWLCACGSEIELLHDSGESIPNNLYLDERCISGENKEPESSLTQRTQNRSKPDWRGIGTQARTSSEQVRLLFEKFNKLYSSQSHLWRIHSLVTKFIFQDRIHDRSNHSQTIIKTKTTTRNRLFFIILLYLKIYLTIFKNINNNKIVNSRSHDDCVYWLLSRRTR